MGGTGVYITADEVFLSMRETEGPWRREGG